VRVALVTDGVYPFFKGGKEMRSHQLLRHMTGSTAQIQVFTMHWWDGPRTTSVDGVGMRAICRPWSMYAGERRSITQALMFAVACTRLVAVRADVVDVDHMPYLHLLPLKAICRLRGIPMVVTWHEWWGASYWRTYLGPAGMVGARLERYVAGLADRLIVETDETASRLVASGIDPGAISVLPLGIDLDAIAAAPPDRRRYDVVCVGRLIAHKGVHVLLEALAELAGRGRTVRCAVVGEGPELDRLTGLAERLGLADHIDFLGRLEGHDSVYSLMKSATVVASPTTREGYGLAVAEALACGTQVVTTDHPDNHARHLVRDGVTGHLCAPTVQGLAGALDRALASPFCRDDVRAGAAALGWGSVAHDLGAIYAAAAA
jgi:glycosyltransferase involved in cell wall biosynthesis